MIGLGLAGTEFPDRLTVGNLMRYVAIWFIPAIQIFGPLSICCWAWPSRDSIFNAAQTAEKQGTVVIFQRGLSALFLFLFAMYSIATTKEDEENGMKIRLLADRADVRGSDEESVMSSCIGPLINIWVILLCTCDMVLVFWKAESPKDVVFDSLGLLFLYNLSYVPGSLDAIFPAWPAATVGEVYWRQVQSWFSEMELTFEDDHNWEGVADPDFVYEHADEVYAVTGIGRNPIYRATIFLLKPLAIILPIIFIRFDHRLKADSLE